jgi:NhaA family Na+:H+ antiporter
MAVVVSDPYLPQAPIDRALGPLRRFIAVESASGLLLLLATAIALTIANSPWSGSFAAFWETHLHLGVGPWQIDESLLHWINDGLMTIFFFVVGLEIKRELIDGELNEVRKAVLPMMAAIGGMIVPAGTYLALISGEAEGTSGWGIPMATDIAFVVGFLAVLGRRVPIGLKVLLLALAIVDDIGAILVIALFYSQGVSSPALLTAAAGLALTIALHRVGVRSFGVFALAGIAIWLAMFHSGIHPTVAGVILGLLTPAKPILPRTTLLDELANSVTNAEDDTPASDHSLAVKRLTGIATETISPLQRLEDALHPWVAFVIMPLFALANAGVQIQADAIAHPVAWSVAMGLVLGKPVGIVLLSWLAVKGGIATLPAGVTWKSLTGAACLAGIGFTMSLFIANLALEGDALSAGKIGTLLGSLVSAILGMGLLVSALSGSALVSHETRTTAQ